MHGRVKKGCEITNNRRRESKRSAGPQQKAKKTMKGRKLV